MKLPQRVKQHISETASYKLFLAKIPDSWVIRDVTERDYGIDCYVELVNKNNELTGELVLIQLKSRQSIKWNKNDSYTLSGVNIETSNYWYKFSVPVFIFLADLENQTLYMKSVNHWIKRNFLDFVKQDKFNYIFKKTDSFDGEDGVFAFKFYFYYEQYRMQFENELLFFLTNLRHFIDFQSEHNNLDFHLGIEGEDLIFFESMHRNYDFLCMYFGMDNPIPSMNELKNRSKEKFKNDFYELYEHDLTEWMETFEKLTNKILTEMKSFLHGELNYWMIVNPTLYNYIINLNPHTLRRLRLPQH